MVKILFRGLSLCPRHEACVLLLNDAEDKPFLRFQVSHQQGHLLLDEIARARGGCCSSHHLLESLMKCLGLQVKYVVFKYEEDMGKASIHFSGFRPNFLLTVDPLDALVLAVSQDYPIYADMQSGAPASQVDANLPLSQDGTANLPQAFHQFIENMAALKEPDQECQKPE